MGKQLSTKAKKNLKDNLERMSDDQAKILSEKYKIDSGRKVSEVDTETLIKEIKNRDDLFDNGKLKPKEEVKDAIHLITEKDLKAEKEAEEQKEQEDAIRYQREFQKQLAAWADEEVTKAEQEEYNRMTFNNDEYLVRMFKMDISDFDGYFEQEIYVSELQGGRLAQRQKKATENIHPIVKILKVGNGVKDPQYKEGDIVMVVSRDVYGEQLSPEFQLFMQNQNSMGMNPVIPKDYRQWVPNVEINWKNYNFVRPWVQSPEDKDFITFLLPLHRLVGNYEVDEVSNESS